MMRAPHIVIAAAAAALVETARCAAAGPAIPPPLPAIPPPLPAIPPPGAVFNLSAWTLQLPVSDGHGGVVEIKEPQLDTYTSEYFYTNGSSANNAMTFWCPEDGAHTSGSSYPRSELRETADWTFIGTNRLNVTIAVLEEPTGGAITIGQVHVDGLSHSCSIVIELEWESGDIVAHLRDDQCNPVSKTVGTGYAIGDPVHYSIGIDGLDAFASTDTGSMPPYSYSWMNTSVPIYFKVGDYVSVWWFSGRGRLWRAVWRLVRAGFFLAYLPIPILHSPHSAAPCRSSTAPPRRQRAAVSRSLPSPSRTGPEVTGERGGKLDTHSPTFE
jgi:hypothetical protein